MTEGKERFKLVAIAYLEELRKVFKDECRDRMRMTIIARDPFDEEVDLVVTNDNEHDLIELLKRSSEREEQKEWVGVPRH